MRLLQNEADAADCFQETFVDALAFSRRQDVVNPGGSQLTGTWVPDGRAIDPASSGSTFDSTSPTATLGSFTGNNPNGTWDFFLADLAPGDQSTLVSFGVTVTTVPEPKTSVLMGIAALFGFNQHRKRFSGQKRD